MDVNDPDFGDNARTIMSIAKRNVDTYFGPEAKRTPRDRTQSGESTMTRSQQVYKTIASIRDQSISRRSKQTAIAGAELYSQGSNVNFPSKLFAALSCDQFIGSITWNDAGDAWNILNFETFFASALRHFTGGTTREHFNKFFHLVSVWRFQNIELDSDVNVAATFHHEKFHRDHADLVSAMVPKLTDVEPPAFFLGEDGYKNDSAHPHPDDDIVASIARSLNSQSLTDKCAAADEILSFPGGHGHVPTTGTDHKDDSKEPLAPAVKQGTTSNALCEEKLSQNASVTLPPLGNTSPDS